MRRGKGRRLQASSSLSSIVDSRTQRGGGGKAAAVERRADGAHRQNLPGRTFDKGKQRNTLWSAKGQLVSLLYCTSSKRQNR